MGTEGSNPSVSAVEIASLSLILRGFPQFESVRRRLVPAFAPEQRDDAGRYPGPSVHQEDLSCCPSFLERYESSGYVCEGVFAADVDGQRVGLCPSEEVRCSSAELFRSGDVSR